MKNLNQFFRLFILVILFSLLTNETFGQYGKKAGGGPSGTTATSAAQPAATGSAPTSSATSAASSAASTLNYYYISKNFHLRYHTKTISADTTWVTIPTTANYTVTVNTVVLVRKIDVQSVVVPAGGNAPNGNYPLFKAINSLPSVKVLGVKGPYFDTLSKRTQCVVVTTTPCPNTQKVPLIINDIVRYDDIDRYYGIGPAYRATITPADSGKLQTVPIVPARKLSSLGGTAVNVIRYIPTGKLVPAIPMSKSDSAHNFYMQIDYNGDLEDRQQKLRKVFFSLQGGAITIPYKYRFANKNQILTTNSLTNNKETVYAPSESTLNYNLAAYLGEKFGLSSFFYNSANNYNSTIMFTEFVGLNSIALSQSNVSSTTDVGSIPSTAFAVTYGTSISLEFKSFNVGIFAGKDHIIPGHTGWVYNDKLWVGLGFGFNLTGLFASNLPAIQQ